MIELTFLGTSSMLPTKERNPSSVYVEYKGEGILFDCGEGTQRQMSIAGISRQKVKKILISHWHADHIAGLMGLIQTINNKEHESSVDIFGPKGTREKMDHLMKASVFDQSITLNIHEVYPSQPEKIYENDVYEIWATKLVHSTPVIGYAFVEKNRRRMKVKKLESLGLEPGPLYAKLQKGQDITHNGKKIHAEDVTTIVQGKKIVYITDTLFVPQAIDLAEEADLLICESTFSNDQEELAHQYKHMTARQAAQVGSMANVKKVILTHFSQRHQHIQELLEQAREAFDQVELANDFKKVKL